MADTPLPDVPNAARSYVQESGADLATVVKLADAGELRVRVAEHHPVGRGRAVHERFGAGGLPGKVVLLF
ncbi:zinc-binding dehydrogenase [Streptomyces koyangensis]|uniref:zinc-binding dehydrogenase n=1 Tax=Streptomyces koyangensis TaxID=188770 RepID=UPI003C2FF407